MNPAVIAVELLEQAGVTLNLTTTPGDAHYTFVQSVYAAMLRIGGGVADAVCSGECVVIAKTVVRFLV